MRTRIAWGLDIGNSAVKLVRAEESGGRITFTPHGPVALSTELPGPEAVAQALETLLTSAGAKRSSPAVALPRSIATFRFPQLPRVTGPQLAQMVRFEAQRFIPFPLEEVALSFQPLPGQRHTAVTAVTAEGTVDQVELLLVAVQREVIAEYQAAMNGHISPSHLSVSSLGLWNAVHAAAMPLEHEEALVVVDIGGKTSTVVAFHGGEMVYNRSAGIGGDSLTTALMSESVSHADAEAEKRSEGLNALLAGASEGPLSREASPAEGWAQALVSELRRSLAALRGERKTVRVERVYLSGGGAKTPGLAAYVEAALGLPTQTLQLPGVVPDPQFLEAAGMALGGLERGVSTVDLVQEEVERARVMRRQRMQTRLALLVGAVILIGAIALGLSVEQTRRDNQMKIDKAQLLLDHATSKFKANQKAYDDVMQRAQMLDAALRPPHTWLDLLQEVSDRTPSGVWLSGIDLEKGKPLALRGSALSQGAVQTLWGNLARSPLLIRPTLSYSNAAKVAEKQIFQFGVSGEIMGNQPKPVRPPRKKTTKRPAPGPSGASGTTK